VKTFDDWRQANWPPPPGVSYHDYLRAVWDAATAAERERLGRPPAGQYRCGCPLVRSDNIKAFCPTHHKCIVPEGEPT
jgi:hypothetical protein